MVHIVGYVLIHWVFFQPVENSFVFTDHSGFFPRFSPAKTCELFVLISAIDETYSYNMLPVSFLSDIIHLFNICSMYLPSMTRIRGLLTLQET